MATLQPTPTRQPGASASRKRHAPSDRDRDLDQGATASPSRGHSLASSPLSSAPKRSRLHSDPMLATASSSSFSSSRPDHSQNLIRQLSKYLSILDKDQLVDIVMHIASNGSEPVHDMLAQVIPRPSVAAVTKHLASLERKLLDAFPYSSSGPVFNDYSYSRVQPVLSEIQTTIVDFLEYFINLPTDDSSPGGDPATAKLNHISTVIDFLHSATLAASRLPNWQTPMHNLSKLDLMHRIAYAWRMAVAEAAKWGDAFGRVLAGATVEEWSKRLSEANTTSNNHLQDAVRDFSQLLAWRMATASTSATAPSYEPQLYQQQQGLFSSGPRSTITSCGLAAASMSQHFTPPAAPQVQHQQAFTFAQAPPQSAPSAPSPTSSLLFGASSPALFDALNGTGANSRPMTPANRVEFGMGK